MMRLPSQPQSRLRLHDLLKRRRMGLKQFIDEYGISTYEGLVNRCDRMGVGAPTEEDFRTAFPSPPVNNPIEGVVVVEAPAFVDDITGRSIDPDAPVIEPTVEVITAMEQPQEEAVEPTDASQKRQKRKKKDIPEFPE